MIYLNTDRDPLNQVKIPIQSDGYVGGIPTFIKKNPNNYSSTNLINEITKFFKSKWAWFLSPSDPEVILERLEHEKPDSVKKPGRAWEGPPKHRR